MRLAPLVKSLRSTLPAPALIGLAGLALFWLMARFDGAQSARLSELDQQQQATVEATLSAAKARRAVKAASEATDRENARLRALVAQRDAAVKLLRHRADSLTGAIVPVLAGLPDSVSHPIAILLALKDSVIVTQGETITDLRLIADSLQADRDRWKIQSGRDAALATQWEGQARRWEHEARRACLPLLGCIGRSTVALVAGGLGFVGGIVASR